MKNKIKISLLVIGTILFNLLFWKEAVGINLLIFTIFIIGSIVYLFPEFIKTKNSTIVVTGTLISALTVTYHASELAIFVWVFSIVLFQAFVHNKKLKSVFYAYLSSISSFFTSYQLLGQSIKIEKKYSLKFKTIFKYLKLTLIPILVVYIFYWIFKFANPIFDKLSNTFFINFNEWVIHIFRDISFLQILFTFWGFVIMAWYLYENKNTYKIHEDNYFDTIIRKRKKTKSNIHFYESIGLRQLLKNEFRIGLMLIILVNILLLMINIIDISTIWFNFEYTAGFDLKQFVHEGTYLLILSILLSIGIMIWFFRKNINFYPYKKKLQIASYIWIVQNIVLLISVVIRNAHYIEYFGLAYKRIGVFFFLALVIFGLISLYLKIKDIKSSYWLFKINSWALYIGFVLFAIPDWDIIIAKHNLEHPFKNNMETSFLLTFDDKALPLIDERRDILKQSKQYNTYRFFYDTYENVYEDRVKYFVKNYSKKSWLSWNYADNKSYRYFRNNAKN